MMIDIWTVSPVAAVVLAILLGYLRRVRRLSYGHLLCMAAFFIYLMVVARWTVFPLRFDDEFVTEMRGINGGAQMVNLVPFAWYGFPPDFTDEQIYGNIVLAMPFGFGWPFLVGRGIRQIAIAGVVFALAIELVQLLIDLGYGFGYRTVDVTDVLLYVAGVAAGYLVFRVASGIYRRILGNDHADRGIWGHAHRVLVG